MDYPQTTRIHLIIDGEEAFASILQCISEAKKSIRIRMFMWRNDEAGIAVLTALESKIRKTPSIFITIEKDAFGSRVYNLQKWLTWGKVPGDIFSSRKGILFLKKHKKNVRFVSVGSKSLIFFKILKENDHSKLFIFDAGTPRVTALIGGMNIGNEYLTALNAQDPDKGGWHDYMVLIQGPPADHFLPPIEKNHKPWFAKKMIEGMEIMMNIKGRRKIKHQILRELSKAKRSVVVEHGYLTDDTIIRRLRHISRKGVHVTVIIPDRSDGVYNANMHSIYKLLRPFAVSKKLPHRIKVYLYQGMIHAKVIVIDSTTSIIGSANLTTGSFRELNETNAIFRDKEGITKELIVQLQKDLKKSKRLDLLHVPSYNRFRAAVEKIFI